MPHTRHEADYDDGQPAPSELAEDAADLARAYARQHLAPPTPLEQWMPGDLARAGHPLPPDVTVTTAGLAAGVVRLHGPDMPNHPVVRHLGARPDYDVLIRDGHVFVRRNGQPHPDSPF